MLKNPIVSFQEASSETKQFIITLIILFIIVLGTFFFVYMRIDAVRSGPKPVAISSFRAENVV